MPRPYVLLSVAVSLDGYIDDTSPDRLMLSNDDDFDRVDSVRAEMDAILIGAETMRTDNPRLLVKSDERRRQRIERGDAEYPLKVTVTRSGKVSRSLKFWHYGGEKVAYTTHKGYKRLAKELDGLADVVEAGNGDVDFEILLDDLGNRGIRRLMVEGGGSIHTAFLSAGLADELHLAIAPVVVGETGAPRFLHDAPFAQGRMELAESRQIGDVVFMRYLPKARAGAA